MTGKLIPLATRFWARVKKTNYCWIWCGRIEHNGYGRMHYSGSNKSKHAHRVSLELIGIDVPKGQCVDHICRNRACVNPSHLRVVDLRTNSIENSNSVSAINHRKTHCHNGHAYATHGFVNATGRQCRTCRNAYALAWYHKKQAAKHANPE